jgi:hypothetical protein
MTHIVYALVDPNTLQVRYVGRTSQTAARRLRHHLGAARRGSPKSVYAWIRSIAPALPIIVVLQEVEHARIKRNDGLYETTVAAAETKWMKRFERSKIFNSIDRSSGAYRRLVNPSE